MQTLPLLLLFLGHTMVDTSQGILPVVVAKLKELFQLSYFQVGLMMMVLNLSSSVIQPIFGYISDKFRTGWFIPIGIIWTAVAMGLLGWVPNYPMAVLLVGLAGLGTAAFHPRAMMAVFLVSGSKKGLGTAIFSTGGNLGFAIGPMVGGFLILGFGLHGTLGLIPFALVLFLVVLFQPRVYNTRVSKSRGTVTDLESEVGTLIPWVPLVALCLIVTLRSWVYMSFITFLPMFFQNQGIALASGSKILTVFLICGAVAGLYGGHISDRVGRKTVIAISSLIYPFFAMIMLSVQGPWLWVIAGAAGAALLASFSVTLVLAQELLPKNLGLASGLILGLGFGTGGLGTAVSGFLADSFGLYKTFWVLALIPFLAAGLTLLIKLPGYPDPHPQKTE